MSRRNLTHPSEVRALLQERGIRPYRTRGQNFLIDRNVLRFMVDTARPRADDVILEVGPGLGVLTEQLLPRTRRVLAVEIDHGLCRYLRDRFAQEPRLELIESDILDLDLGDLLDRGVTKVVANLPYSTGTRFLMELVPRDHRLRQILVTLQAEVARRLVAEPGSRDYGLLAVTVRRTHDVRIRKTIAATCFYPSPKVRSALVDLVRLPAPRAAVEDVAAFQALVKRLFAQRRKQLATVLDGLAPPGAAPAGELLADLGIDPEARPGTLTIEAWGRLANALSAARKE